MKERVPSSAAIPIDGLPPGVHVTTGRRQVGFENSDGAIPPRVPLGSSSSPCMLARADEGDSEPPDRRRCTGSSPAQRQRTQLDLPVVVGTEGERARRHRAAARQDGLRDARSGVHEHRVDQERDHVPRRREGHPALPRHPDRAARREVDLRRDGVPPHLRRAARSARS